MADHLIVRARWLILAAFVALSAWIIPGVDDVREDNDVLAFLPPDHPEVKNFHEVAERFGMLEIGLIGLQIADGDVLSVEAVDQIRALSKTLGELPGVKVVLSYTDLPNPVVHDDGLEVAPLVPDQLRDPAEIRSRVLGSRDAVGNLISADGEAAALMVFLLHEKERDVDARAELLSRIREVTRERWTGEAHFTGAPFIEQDAALASRADIVRLSPIVIGVLILVSGVLLGSFVAAILNVLVTGLGVGLVMGAHGVFGEALTIVSSSIPVMMVALGGAFGVHVLAGFQRQHGESSRARASAVIRELWRPVLLSGLTTSVAFFALLVMPQVPMQRFGVAAGVGVLVLLALALFLMPALLALLPSGWMKPKPERPMPLRVRPPLWALLVLAVAGVALSARMTADPDTGNVFSADSEPRRASAFFDDHFGGSIFLQVTVEGPLGEAVSLRELRVISEQVAAIDGVVDVRSMVDPVEVLNEALGGRRGIPETAGRAARVLTYLIGHPAMAQLMTDDADGALVHIKLAPMPGAEQVAVTAKVREVLERYRGGDVMYAAPTSIPAVREVQVAEVAARLSRLLGRPIDASLLASDAGLTPTPELRAAITVLRDRALDSEDSPVEGVPREEIEAIDPASLITPRGAELEALLRSKLPTLAEADPEGIGFAAKFLGAWIDEELVKHRARQRCVALGLEDAPAPDANPSPTEDGPPTCASLEPALSELADEEWRVVSPPAGVDAAAIREVPFRPRLTGQPVIGEAFAESVTTSLLSSTAVSVVGLALVLLVARQLFALAPALWTLAVTMGALSLLGVPISVGTSMVSCIAVGAGVDFAIHLLFRARQHQGPDAGQIAVHEIGAVVLISALQLSAAFLVLLNSGMSPLRDFGVGLAIGLLGAGLGACWLVPALTRRRSSAKKA
ncbi:MAG: MMPL family transporter [Myxococcales bacterium]|nr:MMPL family transporter [Myxococcales bacterium]